MFATDADMQRADWELLRHGAVTLFWRKSLFETAKADLRELGYRLIEVSCSGGADQLCQNLSDGLGWLQQFGYEPWSGSLDALNDGLCDPPFGPSDSLCLCFESFERLVAENGAWARGLLDVIESSSRDRLLDGKRLLALVQTEDVAFRSGDLGARPASWNGAERLSSARGLA